METSQLQSKNTYQGIKALLAIKLTIIICFLNSLLTYSQNQTDSDIIKLILEKKYAKNICLIKENSNQNLISEIKNIKKFKDSNNNILLDSIYNSMNIKKAYIKNIIFDDKEIENYIKQEMNSDWSKEDLEKEDFCIQDINSENINKMLIYISKPIYSIDRKTALINVGIKRGIEYFSILRKSKGKWKEYKFIPVGMN